MTRARPDYGIDGYPYLLGLCIGAAAAFGFGVAALTAGSRVVCALLFGLGVIAAIPASLGLHYVVRGKARQRDRLLARVEWRGDEHVLDVGTGGGLLAIGAAKRVPRGRVFGVDTWRTEALTQHESAGPRERAHRGGRRTGRDPR